jgi:hypothetical protein
VRLRVRNGPAVTPYPFDAPWPTPAQERWVLAHLRRVEPVLRAVLRAERAEWVLDDPPEACSYFRQLRASLQCPWCVR